MFALLMLIIAGLAGLLLMFVAGTPSLEAIPTLPTAAAVIAALVLLYIVTFSGDSERRGLRSPLFAIMLLVAAAGGAARYWHWELPPALSQLVASGGDDESLSSLSKAAASVRIRRDEFGQVFANGTVNGQSLRLLVDTGSAAVVLSQSDAIKSGIDLYGLAYDSPMSTAAGTAYLAPTRIKSVRIGSIRVDDVEALVARPGTVNESLLGQSFLRRLASYEMAGDFVTLRQ